MDLLTLEGHWLSLVFAFLMGLSILIYVILDGYDLGVGILTQVAKKKDRDKMIASIGPFWDANETWLVLGVGILLVAFPIAHGVILTSLYLPTASMLISLIIRGVSFDFRAKMPKKYKHYWDFLFFLGSLGASFSQGYMLGLYIVGFDSSMESHLFAILTGICISSGYTFIGGCWLVMKTQGVLQKKSIKWTRICLLCTAVGIALVSIATPLESHRIFEKWFSIPNIFLLAPIPIVTGLLILALELTLKRMPFRKDSFCWLPFLLAVVIFLLSFQGLAYSFYPFIVPDQITIYGASASPSSMMIVFVGTLFVLPTIIGYTIYAHRVFWGKAKDLEYI